MPSLCHRILVVDDDTDAAERTHTWFVREGHECVISRRGGEAAMHVAAFAPDVVLVDLLLRDADGLDVLRALKQQRGPELYVAVTACWAQADTAFRVFAAGGDHYILKPASAHRLRFMLWDAEQRSRSRELSAASSIACRP